MRFGSKTGYRSHSRAIALCVVVLFSFQLSRFFLIVQLDAVECFDPNHTHDATTHSHADSAHAGHSYADQGHQHDHKGEQAPLRSHDGEHYFQHCKDTYGDAGLTPVQPQGAPETVSYHPPEAAWGESLRENFQPLENYLPPPFQPPRNLS
ncbi:MAG: hypothetical protein O7E51_04010 [Acidobacteria bacterium]|nr:hypothetical protein [Acidobacteriota bacterium]